jgi:DNA-binding MarR family transcriptional regulator
MDRSDDVLIALRRVIRATDLHSKYLSKTVGITAPQLLVLQSLRDFGDLPVGELAGKVSLSQATVTSIVDRLEKKGIVRRERSQEDKRKVFVQLTEDGVKIIKDAPAPLQESFVRQFSDLHEWEQTSIISSLQRLAQMMDAQHIDAAPVLDVGILDRASESTTRPEFSDKEPPSVEE